MKIIEAQNLETKATPGVSADLFLFLDSEDGFKLKQVPAGSFGLLNGADVTELTDGGATTLHKHDHGLQDGLGDDDHTQYARTPGITTISTSPYNFAGTETRNGIYYVDSSAGDITVNLNPDNFAVGFAITLTRTSGSNFVTIDSGSGNTINGSQTYLLLNIMESVTLVKNAADSWRITSKYEGEYSRFGIANGFSTRTQTGIVTNQTLVPASLLGSNTLPADFFNIPGRQLHIRLCGLYTTDAAPGTATILIKIGSTTYATSAAGFTLDASATNKVWWLEGMITCRTTGPTGTVSGQFAWLHSENNATGTIHTQDMIVASPVTIDTTAAQTIDVQWTANDAGTSISCTCFTMWKEF